MRGALRVVCVGDSVTFGEHVPTSERWPTLLAEAWPEWNVLMRGVNADTTRLALERWYIDVAAAKPDVVIIQFGHNDMNRWEHDGGAPRVSARAYESNLLEMCWRVRNGGGKPVVVVPYRVGSDGSPGHGDAYIAGARWAAATSGDGLVEADKWITPSHLLDDVHLNEGGHRMMCGLVLEALERL